MLLTLQDELIKFFARPICIFENIVEIEKDNAKDFYRILLYIYVIYEYTYIATFIVQIYVFVIS